MGAWYRPPVDVPPQSSPGPAPRPSLAIGLMVLGAALGVLSVVMATLPLLKLVRDAPSVTTPGFVRGRSTRSDSNSMAGRSPHT